MSDYSSTYPTQSPTFAFDAKAGKLDSRLSYSRSSGGTFMSSEKALNSENLLKQSQDFDTSWTASGIAAPTGSQTAPDGTSTAWLLSCSSGTSIGPRILQSFTATSNTEYTAVAHIKAGTASHGYLSVRTDGTNQYAGALLDFSAGTISVTSAGMTSASGTVTALGSNWFKVTVTATSSSSLGSPSVNIGISDGTAIGSFGRAVWSPAGTETMYAWGVQLSTVGSTVYDSPTTTQISRSYSQLLKTASADSPRFEFAADGQSDAGSPRGLLIEAQATNLLTYSEDFSNAAWTKTNTLVSSNSGIAPTGELTADLVTAVSTGANTSNTVNRAFSFTSGNTYTFSFFAKAAGYSKVRFYPSNGTTLAASATFDLSGNGATSSVTGTAKIEHVGNGYYRCSVSGASGQTAATNINIALADAGGSTSFDGDDYSGVLLFGASLEQSSSMSSYIKTTSSSVSRAADSCSVADFGYTGGPLTVVSETETQADENNRIIINIDKNTSNRFYVYGKSANSRAAMLTSGGTNHFLEYSADANGKHAVRFDTNNYSTCVNGGTVTDFVGNVSLPDVSGATMLIGDDANSGNSIEGHIKRLALYNVALSDAELQAITS